VSVTASVGLTLWVCLVLQARSDINQKKKGASAPFFVDIAFKSCIFKRIWVIRLTATAPADDATIGKVSFA